MGHEGERHPNNDHKIRILFTALKINLIFQAPRTLTHNSRFLSSTRLSVLEILSRGVKYPSVTVQG